MSWFRKDSRPDWISSSAMGEKRNTEASAIQISISYIGFYSYLPATKKEDIDIMEIMDIITTIYGTR